MTKIITQTTTPTKMMIRKMTMMTRVSEATAALTAILGSAMLVMESAAGGAWDLAGTGQIRTMIQMTATTLKMTDS